MNKIKAIWKLIRSNHFYLITSNEYLVCNESISDKTDQVTISKMIALEWETFWKGVYISNVKDSYKYI